MLNGWIESTGGLGNFFRGGLRISENVGCELWVLCRF